MSSRITLNRLMALMTLVFGLVLLWRQMLPTSPQLAVARPPLGVEGTTQTPKLGDLPTHPAIPRIIHQTWAEGTIPSQFTPWVRSWMAQNPSWEYWFWTDADIHCFMQHHFPAYLGLYDNYHHNINRADIMRCVHLYLSLSLVHLSNESIHVVHIYLSLSPVHLSNVSIHVVHIYISFTSASL